MYLYLPYILLHVYSCTDLNGSSTWESSTRSQNLWQSDGNDLPVFGQIQYIVVVNDCVIWSDTILYTRN